MALFLLLVIVALALGLTGALVKGLFYLLIIGIAVFVLDLVFGGHQLGRRRASRLPR